MQEQIYFCPCIFFLQKIESIFMKNKAIQWGIFSGISLTILNIILYLAGPKTMINYGGYGGWVVHLVFMFLATKQYRESIGNVMTLKEGFKKAWQVFAIASIFEGIFAYVMFNFVDSSLYEIIRDIRIEWAAWSCEMSGIDPCTALQDAKKIQVEDLKLSIGTTLYSTAYRLIIPGAIFAFLIAGMTRREKI